MSLLVMGLSCERLYVYDKPNEIHTERKKMLCIVDMGGFGHRVNSDSIRNGGVI